MSESTSSNYYSSYKGKEVDNSVGAVLDADLQIGHGLTKEEGKLYLVDQNGEIIGSVEATGTGIDVLDDLSLTFSNSLLQLTGYNGQTVGSPVIITTANSLVYTEPYLFLVDAQNNILSTVTIHSAPEVDGKSITFTGDSTIQTVGVIDRSDEETSIKTWTGTKNEYAELGTYFAYSYGSNTVYVREVNPTTSSQLYSGIDTKLEGYSIQAVDTDSIELSSGNIYTRDIEADTVDETRYSSSTIYNITGDSTSNNVYTKDETYSKEEVNNLLETKEGEKVSINRLSGQILEVPQHILYEIDDNGQFVLKAGSTVISPDGLESDGVTPKFLEIAIVTDIVTDVSSNADGTYMIYSTRSGNALGWRLLTDTNSGDTDPATTGTTFYNTLTNTITSYNSTTPTSYGVSFPVAHVKVAGGVIWSIVDTFNSMGFIGRTVWVGKGVKFLCPTRRDSNGQPHYTECITNEYLTLTYSTSARIEYDCIFLHYNETLDKINLVRVQNSRVKVVYSTNYLPANSYTLFYYITEDNVWLYSTEDYGWIDVIVCPLLRVTVKATSLVEGVLLYKPAPVLTRNDANEISGYSVPSSNYITLTVGTADALYTAPANGYFYANSKAIDANVYLYLNNRSKGTGAYTHAPNNIQGILMLPVSRGDIVNFAYFYISSSNLTLRFYYAEGEML